MEIIAKKRNNGKTQSLEQHTLTVLEYTNLLADNNLLRLLEKKLPFTIEKLKDLIFFSAYFHDIGKATEEFKQTVENNKKSYHSLYSSSIVANITEFELSKADELFLNVLFLVILSHHSIYREDLFSGIKYEGKYQFNFLKIAEDYFNEYQETYQELMQKPCKYQFGYQISNLEELNQQIDSYLKEDLKDIGKNKNLISFKNLRLLYSIISGILNLSDWLASAAFDGYVSEISFNKVPTKEEIIEKLSTSIRLKQFIPKSFQEELSNIKGNVLVEIPTGEGKTEGSYLWAINNIHDAYSKIIYTLPTQTTSNKLYDRAKKIFGNHTGLLHSSAEIYLEDQYEEENGIVDDAFHTEMLFTRSFNKPFTVSTLDSLLNYFLNAGRYNIATYNYLKSSVIIDEVHSYDLKLLGFLKRFLELSEEYNVPVCIMSASIPNVLKEKLNLKNYQTITDKNLFDKKANRIIKIQGRLEDNYEVIQEEYYKGKSVLIVRNKIASSINTFKELKKRGIENVMLYHSQFKKKDRVLKEEQIYKKLKNNEHFILVATQVVEISLDIDFQVMFSDVAPIDALIQRFGRVNRRKNKHRMGKIYIFSNTDIKPYYEHMLNLTFKTIKEGVHSLGEYTQWLNEVYDNLFKIDIKTINELESLFREGYRKFDEVMNTLQGISQSKEYYSLRQIEFPKKDYILLSDYDKGNISYEYTVSLGSYFSDDSKDYLLQRKNMKNKLYFDVLNLKYNYQLGVIVPTKDEYEMFI